MQVATAHALHDPRHRVDVVRDTAHIEVRLAGETIAATDRGLIIDETGLSLRYYVPREDVEMAFLQRTTRHSSCPYKGEASYFTVRVGDTELRNRAWSYEDPFEEVAVLAGAIAFYQERLEVFVDGERV